MEEEGENHAPREDDEEKLVEIWKRSLSDLELEPEPEPNKLGIQEEMVARVMKWLEMEIASTSPSSSSSSFLQETEFVTINGNEETCGSSFSGTASTIMASVDTKYEAPYLGSTWPFAGGEVEVEVEVEVAPTVEIDGGDDEDWMDFIVGDDLVEMEAWSSEIEC